MGCIYRIYLELAKFCFYYKKVKRIKNGLVNPFVDTPSIFNRYRGSSLNAYFADTMTSGGLPMGKSKFYTSQTSLVLIRRHRRVGRLGWLGRYPN